MYCTLNYIHTSCHVLVSLQTTAKTHTGQKHMILLCQGDEQVDLPILEVSRSNTTSVEFWISDVLRGVDVGA